jgi:hypothetical protein
MRRAVGSMNRRVGALEEYIESQVQARMEAEIEAILDVLEEKLTREEFIRFARIIMESAEDTNAD